VGSAIGGVLGSQLGLMTTIAVGSALTITAVLWILAGPVRLRHQPAAEP
jgi:predicted MFS family arabinose efflux permease